MKYRTLKTDRIIKNSAHLQKLIQSSHDQQQIFLKIKELLEPQLAAHCISTHYSGQSLKLFTDSSVWASRFRFQSKSLLKKLYDNHLPVHKLDVKVIPESRPPEPRRHPARRISEKAAQSLIDTAATINDEKLETALRKLADSALKKKPDQ
ncbi:MAG: DUF721 domain-containing protein [Gammaproteobacteria bacterium]|nr:DUF721 domain-containing protein [Gammaproteobacteria bacterium]NNJ91017.1 DUF721 domain-containing protein [Gammaproteobacteria bacterium]